jgi:hypothetical protein
LDALIWYSICHFKGYFSQNTTREDVYLMWCFVSQKPRFPIFIYSNICPTNKCIYSTWYLSQNRYCYLPLIAASSNKVVTNTTCCRYICLLFYWWVVVPPETCRAVSK